jgi:phage shock protein A
MALMRRVTRLFTADLHAALDQIEEPEVALKQAVRDMEEELAKQRQRSKWLLKEIESVESRIAELGRNREDLDAKLDLCFENDNETLARKLTRRKLEVRALEARAARKHAALSNELTEHEAVVAANLDQLEGMRQKAELMRIDAPSRDDAHAADDAFGDIDDDDVEVAFLQEKQARASS